jgi:hypothetical protein
MKGNNSPSTAHSLPNNGILLGAFEEVGDAKAVLIVGKLLIGDVEGLAGLFMSCIIANPESGCSWLIKANLFG